MNDNDGQLLARLEGRVRSESGPTYMSSYYANCHPTQLRPPVSEQKFEVAEHRLGFRLPAMLRLIYTRIADGGFGPGYGLFGLLEGGPGFHEAGIVEEYQGRTSLLDSDFPLLRWPERLLPVVHWGCNIWSCLQCPFPERPIFFFGQMLGALSDPIGLDHANAYEALILRYDANRWDPDDHSQTYPEMLTLGSDSFRARLEAWLEGRLEFRAPYIKP